MAKVKVYELAKELNIGSKEIINFLSEKSIKVTSHMNNLEDSSIELVKSKFGKKETGTITRQESETKVKETAQTGGTVERPKKKRSITAVFNPQNSQQGIRRQPKPQRRPKEKPVAKPVASTPEIKPEVKEEAVGKPVSVQSVQPAQNAQPVQKTQPAQNAQPVQKTQPAQNAQPVQKTQPVQNAQPVQKTQPVQNAQPVQKAQPAQKPQQTQKAPFEKAQNAPQNGERSSQGSKPAYRQQNDI